MINPAWSKTRKAVELEYVLDNCGYCQKVPARDQTDGRSVPTFRGVMEVGEEYSLGTIASGPLEPDEDLWQSVHHGQYQGD
jgi:hypothetical protein